MLVLFIGDLYSEAGRLALHRYLPKIKEKYKIDFTIVNGENTTHGRGLSQKHYSEIINSGADFITMGNHTFDNNEIHAILRNKINIVRPFNIESCYDGDGSRVVEVKGQKIRITNIIGRAYTRLKGYTIINPFDAIDDLLDVTNEKIHIIDFHAETNGEKKSFAKYVDGRVSAVVGTHTHVQTADNQVFKGGTAYISDVGYCGAYDSVLGTENTGAIAFCKNEDYKIQPPALSDELEFSAVLIDIDEESGKSRSIKRIYLTPECDQI